jgi:SAM-dependent methyltransferase
MNKGNIPFYDNIDIAAFKQQYQITGFSLNKDMDIIYPIIQNTEAVAEIGVGYGRVVSYLLEKGYKGKIIGVERTSKYMSEVKQLVGESPQVEYYFEDVLELTLKEKVDALFSIGNFTEFDNTEQLLLLKKYKEFLKPGGKAFLELPGEYVLSQEYLTKRGFKKEATEDEQASPQHVRVKSPHGDLFGYIPFSTEVQQNAKEAGFASVEKIEYSVRDKDHQRTIYVLTNTDE